MPSSITNRIILFLVIVSFIAHTQAYFRLGKREAESQLRREAILKARERRLVRLRALLDTDNVKLEEYLLACIEHPEECERRDEANKKRDVERYLESVL